MEINIRWDSVYPYLVTKPDIQKWIRKTLIKIGKMN